MSLYYFLSRPPCFNTTEIALSMSKRFKGLPYYQKQESFFAQKIQFDSFRHQSSYFLENILKNYILVISFFLTLLKTEFQYIKRI